MAYYIPKSYGRQYTRNTGRKSKPATPRENVASIERRIDELTDQRAGVTDERLIASLDSQIAHCKICLDRAMEAAL
jgi:hypothetical protein